MNEHSAGRKMRLDELLVMRELAPDVDRARRLIMAGEVRSGDRVLDKAGLTVEESLPVQLKHRTCPYVSWGGVKLAGALDQFGISVEHQRCLDIGASTGGFTHVLLQRGAASVAALDVAYGFLDQQLRNDARVQVLERTNVRLLPDDFFRDPFSVITADVSFISLRQIVSKVAAFLTTDGHFLALIKPQFEAERHEVEPGGLVTDPAVHEAVILRLQAAFQPYDLYLHGLHDIRRSSPRKNREFLSWWRRTPSGLVRDDLLDMLRRVDTQPANHEK